jgi:hypothetical protein
LPIDLDRSILLVAGTAMVALALVVLAFGPGRGLNRALAALVGVRGATVLLPQLSNDPEWTWTAIAVQPYFGLAVVPLALYCLAAFTEPARAKRLHAGWWAFAAVAVLDLAYFLDHSLVQTLRAGDAEVGALRAADGIAYASFGPLWLLPALAYPVLAYLGLRLAIQSRKEPHVPLAPLRLLVSAGLVLGGLFDGASRLAALTALLDSPGSFPWLPWGWAVAVLPVTALVPALLAVAVLASDRSRAERPHRAIERAVLILAGFAFFSGFIRLVAPSDSDVAGGGLVLVLLGLWRLAMPALITYAIVRHPIRPETIPDGRRVAEGKPARLPPNALDSKPLVR